MMILVRSLLGLNRIPSDRTAATHWLSVQKIGISTKLSDGRNPAVVSLSDLPEPERRAYLERCIERDGLQGGEYNEAMHTAFLQAPRSMQSTAEHKAAIARLLLSLGQSVSWPDRIHLVQQKFGIKGNSKPSLMRLLKRVKTVDPINLAPALLQGYKGKTATAKLSGEAWSFFMTTIRDSGSEFSLKQAWRDVRDLKKVRGWHWPSYPTVYRRWKALPEAQKLTARLGAKATQKQLAQPAFRDKTTIAPLEIVSLDGRTQDFWILNADGQPKRMTMLALVDVASNMVLDYELADSENARDTLRLISRVCQTYGIVDKIYTDNGSAFAGHLVAGGNVHKFRNGGKHLEGVKPLGICFHLGIKLQFALPANGQAKIAERTFATLSRVIDDRPEFKGAHAGHSAGANPDSNVTPVDLATAERVIRREVDRHNNEAGRRSQGAQGRSYAGIFHSGVSDRIMRKPTKRQLYLAGLIYTPVAVDRVGQVRVETWVYGGPETQADLLPFHGNGQRILLGRDPDDFAAPALAFNKDGRLICDEIEAVIAGAYDSAEGVRVAARNRKAARDAVAAAETANDYLTNEEFEKALAQLPSPKPDPVMPQNQVIAPRFGGPLETQKKQAKPRDMHAVPQEYLDNWDAARAAKRR